jgi:hypothetical protein
LILGEKICAGTDGDLLVHRKQLKVCRDLARVPSFQIIVYRSLIDDYLFWDTGGGLLWCGGSGRVMYSVNEVPLGGLRQALML